MTAVKSKLMVLVCAFGMAQSGFAQISSLILNEYNAVGSSKYLGGNTLDSSTNRDVFFGRGAGNGGNWFELAVTTDHLDVRGWNLQWSYFQDAMNNGSGTLTLSDDSVWKDMRSGTQQFSF
jgi:hypothetical protein